MSRFVIPVMWTLVAEIPVDANSLEEAKEKALKGSPPGHLPLGGTLLAGSFVVNENEEAMERASLLSPEPFPTEKDMPGQSFPGYCGPNQGPPPGV